MILLFLIILGILILLIGIWKRRAAYGKVLIGLGALLIGIFFFGPFGTFYSCERYSNDLRNELQKINKPCENSDDCKLISYFPCKPYCINKDVDLSAFYSLNRKRPWSCPLYSCIAPDIKWRCACENNTCAVKEKEVAEKITEEKCEDIQDLGKRAKCYTDLAKEAKDESYCEKIEISEAPEVRNNCYVETAILKNDPSICWKVETASLASSCWEYFGMKEGKTYRNEEYGLELRFSERWKDYKISEGNGVIEFKLKHSRDGEYHRVFSIRVYPKEIWEQSQTEEGPGLGTYIAERENDVFSYLLGQDDEGYIGFPEVVRGEIYQGPYYDIQTKIIPTFRFVE